MTGFKIPRPATAFSLDRDRKSRGGRREERDHLGFIRKLPCLCCGRRAMVEAAHVRYADPAYGKGMTPMASKPDDRWTVPLDAACHRTGPDAQHNANEELWWRERGIDPLAVAAALYSCSGDEEAAELIIQAARVKAKQRATA
jgi:hypothetical protein